jgi:hypothetical protein
VRPRKHNANPGYRSLPGGITQRNSRCRAPRALPARLGRCNARRNSRRPRAREPDIGPRLPSEMRPGAAKSFDLRNRSLDSCSRGPRLESKSPLGAPGNRPNTAPGCGKLRACARGASAESARLLQNPYPVPFAASKVACSVATCSIGPRLQRRPCNRRELGENQRDARRGARLSGPGTTWTRHGRHSAKLLCPKAERSIPRAGLFDALGQLAQTDDVVAKRRGREAVVASPEAGSAQTGRLVEARQMPSTFFRCD